MNVTDKYYWISYYKITAYGDVVEETVISTHPFKEMKILRERYKDCNFTLLNYKEITKEEYGYYLDS